MGVGVMRGLRLVIAGAVLLAAPITGCGTTSAPLPGCASGLRLVASPLAGASLGRDTELFRLRNGSWSTCRVSGYPTLALHGSTGALLPFSYRDGGDQVLTDARPAWVTLAPGAVAYVAIDKSRCGGSGADTVRSVDMTLPGGGRSLMVRLSGVVFDFCPHEHAGQVVAVSPVVATRDAALRAPVS